MPTVINPGVLPTETCKKCGCIFSYRDDEIHKKGLVDRLSWIDRWIVECPCCHEKIVIKNVRK